jgi:hypothetical protein
VSEAQLWKLLLIAAVIESVGLIANAVTSLATDKASGALRWVLPPVIAIVAAMVKVIVDAVSKRPAAGGSASPGAGAGVPPVVRPETGKGRRGRVTWAVLAIVVILVACGGGGFAVTAGVRYAVLWATGNETGDDRLVQPVSGRAAGLTLTVERVEYTAHFTRVELLVRSTRSSAAALPLGGNCLFTGADGTTLRADPFRSDWSETVPPGGTQRGTVTFGGTLPDGVERASVAFGQVFGPGGGSILVRAIPLRSG